MPIKTFKCADTQKLFSGYAVKRRAAFERQALRKLEINVKRINLVTPGETLEEEFLKPLGITKYRLAKEIGGPLPY